MHFILCVSCLFAYTYSYLWYMRVYILLFMVTYSACSYRPYHATSRQSDLSRQIITGSQFHVNVSVLNHLYHALLHTFYIICIMPFCVYIFLLVVTYLYVFISMASRGTAAARVLTHWSCRGLAFGLGCSACMIWCVGVILFIVFACFIYFTVGQKLIELFVVLYPTLNKIYLILSYSLSSKIPWSTVSNAFWRPRNMPTAQFSLSKTSTRFSTRIIN